MRKAFVAAIAAVVLCVACGSEYPPVPKGDRISGTIHYRGTALSSMRRPVVRAYAAVSFPPVGTPNGMVMLNPPNLVAALVGAGVPYEIVWLAPYGYKVIGQIVDLDDPSIDYSALPLGGYPDYCTLLRPGEGLVTVSGDTPITGTDFGIYDQAGSGDPCTLGICPQPEKSTMKVVVKSSQKPTENDRLRVVLFQTVSTDPAAMPTSLRIVPGAGLTFPKVVADNTLVPGSYALADVCLDIGGDSGTGRCTSEDFDAAYAPPSPSIVFPANRIVNLTADLDAGTVTVDGIQSPSELGCR
jgi:hypothetical protein